MVTMRIRDDQHAKHVAAEWQSPGTIGSVLAALASGVPVDREELWMDIDTTIHHDNPVPGERAELEALQRWADTARSPLLTYTCEGHESLAGEHMGETVQCDGSCWVPGRLS